MMHQGSQFFLLVGSLVLVVQAVHSLSPPHKWSGGLKRMCTTSSVLRVSSARGSSPPGMNSI